MVIPITNNREGKRGHPWDNAKAKDTDEITAVCVTDREIKLPEIVINDIPQATIPVIEAARMIVFKLNEERKFGVDAAPIRRIMMKKANEIVKPFERLKVFDKEDSVEGRVDFIY